MNFRSISGTGGVGGCTRGLVMDRHFSCCLLRAVETGLSMDLDEMSYGLLPTGNMASDVLTGLEG
jgi:hypothetical protein